jgi:hypothetical protein
MASRLLILQPTWQWFILKSLWILLLIALSSPLLIHAIPFRNSLWEDYVSLRETALWNAPVWWTDPLVSLKITHEPQALPKLSIPCSVALLWIQVDNIASFHFHWHFMKKIYLKRSNLKKSIMCIILTKVLIYSWALLPPCFHPTCISKMTKGG